MGNYKKPRHSRFRGDDIERIKQSIFVGNFIEADSWRSMHCGRTHGIRGQLRAAAESILRHEGGFKLPYVDVTLDFPDSQTMPLVEVTPVLFEDYRVDIT